MNEASFSMRLFYNDQYSLDIAKKTLERELEAMPDAVERKSKLHQTYCKILPGRRIKRTPVLRFFGQTKRGQKACVNVFDYFPYFYVEVPKIVLDLDKPAETETDVEEAAAAQRKQK